MKLSRPERSWLSSLVSAMSRYCGAACWHHHASHRVAGRCRHSSMPAMRPAHSTAHWLSPQDTWLVWVHQDVLLPEGWDTRFLQVLAQGVRQFPRAVVAGVYGVNGRGAEARRAGHVLDRGTLLR